MSDFSDLLDLVLTLRRELDEHKAATRNMFRVGPVKERDHEKGIRVQHGTDDDPDDSAWVQPAERSGVERDLPRVGQHVMVLAPYGDGAQGLAIPLGHNDDNKNPAGDADEIILFNHNGYKVSFKDKVVTHSLGKTKLTLKEGEFTSEVDGAKWTQTKDGIERKVGDVTQKLTSSGETQTGGTIKHDQRNIGSGHIHSGVMAGAAKTQQPDQ